MNLNKEDMLTIRRNHATNKPTTPYGMFSLGAPRNGEYAKGKDKGNLTREERNRIDEVKDAKTYPNEEDLW